MPRNAVDVDLVGLLSRAERCVTARLAAVLEEQGSSLDDWRVLSLLREGGGLPMSAVAEATMLPPPTLTKRVDRLVAANLVHRRVDDADRRRVLVVLAPRGRATYDRLAPLVQREQERAAAVVGRACDPEALAAGLAALADVHP
jgi:DNA-binding MarR family transcriptional regulator